MRRLRLVLKQSCAILLLLRLVNIHEIEFTLPFAHGQRVKEFTDIELVADRVVSSL